MITAIYARKSSSQRARRNDSSVRLLAPRGSEID
jgi:hypothetical protein